MITMNSIKIDSPIKGTKNVGIAEDKIMDVNFIEILAEDKLGNRLYPHLYKASKEELMKGSVEEKGNVKLRVIPIDSLHLVG